MDIRDVASVCSVIVAIGAALVAWESIRRQTRTQKWLANHQLLMKANDMIIKDPSLLEFHGIDLDAVARDGLSAEQLVFINTHLDASSVLYRISGGKPELTEYRKNFLRHPKVRFAWRNYLKEKTQNPGPWMDAVEAYIKQIEPDKAGGLR